MPHNSIFSLQSRPNQNRIDILDFLRGSGMLLVLLHHSDIPNGQWILAFHMPLLFLLSGYTIFLRPHASGFTNFLKNRFHKLIVPYFLFEGVNLLVWSGSLFLQGGWQDITDAVYAIFACLNTEGYTGYYGRLWFWPCMFISDIYFYCILQFLPRKKNLRSVYQFGMILVLLVISWFTSKIMTFRLPFTIDTAFMATVFLLSGYFLGQQITWLIQKKHILADVLLLLSSLLLMRWAVFSGKSDCLMFINMYGHYGYTLCAAYSGIVAFLILAKWLYGFLSQNSFLKDYIRWFGYNGLCTFPIHLSIKMLIWNTCPLSFRRWYVILPAMLLFNIPIVNLITKYFPFMLGNFPSQVCKRQSSKS